MAYTEYDEDYKVFYNNALKDIEEAKMTREYRLDMENHPNWFDTSFIPWISYDSLNIELPDGYAVARVFILLEEEINKLVN